MTLESQAPKADDLPSSRQLVRATAIAAGVAGVILVTVVLPAEYGLDPTGVGRAFGLTAMGEIKQANVAAAEAAVQAPAAPAATVVAGATDAATATSAVRREEVRLTLAPGEGTEVKATMQAGDQFDYVWATDGAEVRFELHGEATGAPADEYTSYEKGASAGARGTFRAPFAGTHGWYWRNRTASPVTITVTANGSFQSLKHKK